MRASRVAKVATLLTALVAWSCGDDGDGPEIAADAGQDVASDASETSDAAEGAADESPAETGPEAEPDGSIPDVDPDAGEAEASSPATCGHAFCGCAPRPDAGSPDGSLVLGPSFATPEEFAPNMIGCPGRVHFAERATLCGDGYVTCDVDQWIARRAGKVPRHHYWTNETLKFVNLSRDGVHDGCYYSKTYGETCDFATHVCAAVSIDAEGNWCSLSSPDIRNCGRLDPTPPPNEYFGGYYGNFTAGSLCCCDAQANGCADNVVVGDTFSSGMFGCRGKVSWTDRATLCASGCTACTAQQWIERRAGKGPTFNYWTDDNLKMSGSGDGMCNVSKVYGKDGSPWPMRVCAAHRDADQNDCVWINCGAADIAPPPNEYLGGCSDPWAGTMCCRP